MYLQKLEIQGFKSFATRTILEFPSANGEGKGITSIVGPNGSGKSNIADAIRWVLGEQSMKTLRGKKSEDVIFFGAEKKGRLGMAEVSLYLNNEDSQAPIDYIELVITRRLYRNGDSEYLINKNPVRLSDIMILLAKAHFGQRTYSVIGQGMVDHFLIASQVERKEFFDEAAGVKEFQIKKDQTVNKLKLTKENLVQTEITLNELEPRVRSLTRMVKRLEQRGEIEKDLKNLQLKYFGQAWGEVNSQLIQRREEFKKIEAEKRDQEQVMTAIQSKLNLLEQEDSCADVFNGLQKEFDAILEEKNKMRESQLNIQSKIRLARQEAEREFIPLSLSEIVGELEELLGEHSELSNHLDSAEQSLNLDFVRKKAQELGRLLQGLLKKIKKPSSEEFKIDDKLEQELAGVEKKINEMEGELQAARDRIANFNKAQEEKKGEFFDLQRQFQKGQMVLNEIMIKLNDVKVDLARFETKKEDLIQEIGREMTYLSSPDELRAPEKKLDETERAEVYNQIQRAKHQLELIGGIDEESVKEYDEIKDRYEFLSAQHDDLIKAIESLETGIEELDKIIHERFDETFVKINEKFSEYFKILFGGGKANLEKLMIEAKDEKELAGEESEEEVDEDELVAGNALANSQTSKQKKKKVKLDYGGVDIKACPPGKKIASLNTLSGGERAMTAIALICAIIFCNPSPFVVLDEVDAALDEANSERLASILDNLSHKTQFIVVTHNRASMRRANVLYGVTMGEDGVSKMLSVKLEEGERWAK